MTSAINEATNGANNKDLFVIHAGVNNIQRTRLDKLLEKYRKMIRKIKNGINNIIISGRG